MTWKPQDQCTVDPITLKRQDPSSVSTFFLIFFGVLLCFDVTFTLFWSSFKKDIHKRLLYLAICVDIFAFYLYWAFYIQCRPWTGWLLFAMIGFVIKAFVWIVLINDSANEQAGTAIEIGVYNKEHKTESKERAIQSPIDNLGQPKWVIESGDVSTKESEIYLRGSGAKVGLQGLTPPLQLEFRISLRSGPLKLSIDGGGAKVERNIGDGYMTQVIRWQAVVIDVKSPIVTFELDEESMGTVVVSKAYTPVSN